MATKRLEFPGAHGHDLAARLEVPDGTPRAHALFAHCFTCTKNLRAVVQVSRSLCDEGFAVMRFDFTGLGESEGDFADTNFSSNISDLVAAGEYMEKEMEGPRLLVGHSLGVRRSSTPPTPCPLSGRWRPSVRRRIRPMF